MSPGTVGGWVYQNKQQHSTRLNNHTKGYRNPYRKDDRATPVHGNYVCVRCTTNRNHLANECFVLKMTCNKCWKVGHLLNSMQIKAYTKKRN